METFAPAAGAAAEDTNTDNTCQALAGTKEALRPYAIESWLDRFPGFVDDLAPRLHTYASGLRTAEVAYAATLLDGKPADPCGSYWRLITQFQSSHADGDISNSDFQWYGDCARLAIAELDVILASSSPKPMQEDLVPPSSSTIVALCTLPSLPAIQTLLSPVESEGSTFECAVVVAHPHPRIVTPIALASDVGPSHTMRTRHLPTAVAYVWVRTSFYFCAEVRLSLSKCLQCKVGHYKCVLSSMPSVCLRCARAGCPCKRPTGSSCGSPADPGSLVPSLAPSPSSSSAPSPSLAATVIVPTFDAAAPVTTAATVATLPDNANSKLVAYGHTSYWGGELACAKATIATATAQADVLSSSMLLPLASLLHILLVEALVVRGKGKARQSSMYRSCMASFSFYSADYF
jgi:hypothetical protein